MGFWQPRTSDLNSVTTGVLVQPCIDRAVVMITNLSGGDRHITPIVPSALPSGGVVVKANENIKFLWVQDGDLARCQWYIVDGTGTDHFFITEMLYLETGESDGS